MLLVDCCLQYGQLRVANSAVKDFGLQVRAGSCLSRC